MKVQTTFDIGQTVYSIGHDSVNDWEACLACGGDGTITLKDGKKRNCPECYGRKGFSRFKHLAWQLRGTLQIGQVRFQATNMRSTSFASNVGEYDPTMNADVEEEYMCYETGIGSGTVHKISNLFATESEALAECEKRNGVKE